MLIVIDFESEEPIYQQLNDSIMKGILTGELREGEKLLSVREMASNVGVNMHTVNKAYNLLKDKDFLSIDKRKGAIVKKIKPKLTLEYKAKLQKDLDTIIVESMLKGLSKEKFIEICNEIYDEYI